MVRTLTHTAAPRPTRRRAFTLVEILIVVVVVGTIAVAAMPSISATLDNMKATALAREIATDMRYAQVLAVKTGDTYRVKFRTGPQSYNVKVDQDGSWTAIDHPVTKKPWTCELDGHNRYAGIQLASVSFGGANNVEFDAYGSPNNGGAVTFTLGAVTRTIRVAPLSGKITVE